MIDWDKITDEEMRKDVVRRLERELGEMVRQAERNERAFRETGIARHRADYSACARYSRRQAAHYQQAIDLLTAAQMPPEDK